MLIFLLIASTVVNALAAIAIHILVKEIYKHQEDIKDLEHELEGLDHELTMSLDESYNEANLDDYIEFFGSVEAIPTRTLLRLQGESC